MTIEGVREFRMLRDFLYGKMRGVRGTEPQTSDAPQGPAPGLAGVDGETARELAAALREAAAELRAVREAMAARGPGGATTGRGPVDG